ncbi:MAG: hypothetical protein ACI9NY_001219 [Kiritimatiellia bacterium]|jgi:hypothetical protein
MRLTLEKTIASRKSTQVFIALSKCKNAFIANKAITTFLNLLCTSKIHASFLHLTGFSGLTL